MRSSRHQSPGEDRQIKPTQVVFFFTELNMVAIRRLKLFSLIHAKEISGSLISRGGKKGGISKRSLSSLQLPPCLELP